MANAPSNQKFSFASGANAAFIEDLYAQWQSDPGCVDESWAQFFSGVEFAVSAGLKSGGNGGPDEAKVEAMINAYRRLGHLSAHLNPLEEAQPLRADMEAATHGLSDVDHKQIFHPSNLPQAEMSFADILTLMQKTYCNRIGADFRELDDIDIVVWLQNKMEGTQNQPSVSPQVKKRVLQKLTEAEGFERFLQARYLGQKRFSLEGSDSLIPMLDVIIDDAANATCKEVCIGMAHRGRLNVLANFMGKSYELMLKEFEGSEFNPFDIDGDVKYHMGFASEVETMSGQRMRLYLSPNPSHLEAVNPVVEGFVRARQRLLGDKERKQVLPLLMHGDASFIGQGLVAETLNLSRLAAYETGGTIHIIINNQIGFTTEPEESRSCTYASEVAKMIRAPVLHVNADDPEAAIWCAKLAVAFRQAFARDIVIDLIGYRRHGHNEGDEPAFTQPLMYDKIKTHPTVLTTYTGKLVNEGVVSEDEAKGIANAFRDRMQQAYDAVHGKENPKVPAPVAPASLQRSMTYRKVAVEDVHQSVKTGIKKSVLKELAKRITSVPNDFSPHAKVKRLLEQRAGMVEDKIDWGFGELLAFASLAAEGHHIRLSGQDCARGTFSSRHAVLRDVSNNSRLELLNQLSDKQGVVDVINSPLSEQGVLGFEFGYSIADPDSLVLWEAQFGDFCNGAQIIIDQFLSASEAKWKQTSGVVLLLPHGHEGQGPEHSSARPERFLQLCGNLNLQVVNPTTPAQHFHVLRRQLHRDFRKPLVVMTPKSLLRHPECVSPPEDFEKGFFHEILDDAAVQKPAKVEKLLMCSGKLYYQLLQARNDNGYSPDQAPIIRFEQLYPFPFERVQELMARYSGAKELIWVQEEPENMGAWNFIRGRLQRNIPASVELKYIGRKNSGTPAEGSVKAHEAEQNRIITDSLGLACAWKPEKAATGK